jgi:hypothetical protein
MTHRRIHKLIWWLLPLFALRGLVPVGFMVNASDGELSMAVCPMHQTIEAGQSRVDRSLVDPVTGQSSYSSDYSSEQSDSQHKNDSKSECPFAAALSSATFVGISTPAQVPAAVGGFSLHETAVSHVPFGPSRAQQSRAPPRYS